MRWALLSMLSACGFSVAGSADAPDAPEPAVKSRVWVVGDWVTDQKTIAGGFSESATFPFGDGMAPPLVVPSPPAVLATDAGYSTHVFDVSADGTKSVFVADLLVPGRFDLFVANGTGGNPLMLLMGQAGIEIASVKLSPDGSKVAYTRDSTAQNQAYDLWWTTTNPGGQHVKVSPNRVGGIAELQQASSTPSWSRNSRYLAFTGDLSADDLFQAYCADTSTMSPAIELIATSSIPPQASGDRGVRGPLVFDSSNFIYFAARTVQGDARFQLFRAAPDGTSRNNIISSFPTRGDGSPPDVGAIGISADGSKLEVAVDAPTAGTYAIFTLPITSSTATKAAAFPSGWRPADGALHVSPDGKNVAALGITANFSEPYAAGLDNGTARRLLDLGGCGSCPSAGAADIEWNLGGTRLFARGVFGASGATVVELDPNKTDQAATVVARPPPLGTVIDLLIRPE